MLLISDAQRQAFLRAVPALVRAKTEAESLKLTQNLETESGLTRLALGHIKDSAEFFCRQMVDDEIRNEKVELWVQDLLALKLITKPQVKKLLGFLKSLKNLVEEQLEHVAKTKRFGAGVLPSLEGSGTTVELRGVLEHVYKWGTPIGQFSPKILDVVPVVSVRISLDSGDPDELCFQATPENLSYLIDELQAAKKAADALKQKFRIAAEKA